MQFGGLRVEKEFFEYLIKFQLAKLVVLSIWHLVLNRRDLNYFRRPYDTDNSALAEDDLENYRHEQEKYRLLCIEEQIL